jgi:hypothetical protein
VYAHVDGLPIAPTIKLNAAILHGPPESKAPHDFDRNDEAATNESTAPDDHATASRDGEA